MKTVLIIGGGISGLIASYMFRKCKGLDVKVMEPGEPGGEFAAGGLKYIHRTDDMASMLQDVGMVFSNYSARGGILLHGTVLPYPKCLAEMPKERADRIRYDHYRKTRRQEPNEFSARAMNDPEDADASKAIRCDFQGLIKTLALRCDFIKARLAKIEPNFVLTDRGNKHPYDYLILTIPLWVIKRVAYFGDGIPDGHAMSLNLVNILTHRDAYSKWDYVYTPYTPEGVIHRISPLDSGFSCEANGELDDEKLVSDLNFIFPDGWTVASKREGLKGHLLPLAARPNWPTNVMPLGRFAKWDPRGTADVVMDDCIQIARHFEWAIG